MESPEMDAPPVQYARTSDGYDIAYTVRGEGRAFVLVPGPFSDLGRPPVAPDVAYSFDGLASRYRFVQYDARGQGLSTRDLPDELTVDAFVLDLEAVVDHLGLDRFALLGYGVDLGHAAIHYAARHPERVEALILHHCAIEMTAWPSALFIDLPQQNWDMFLNQLGRAITQSVTGPAMRGITSPSLETIVDGLRKAITQHDRVATIRAFSKSRITGLLPGLDVPTLVMHQRDFGPVGPEEARKLATAIPNARLALLDGSTVHGDPAQFLAAIETFLAGVPHTPDGSDGGGANRDLDAAASLSAREVEVLRLLASGKSNQQIADELVISVNTVNRHVSNIFDKIGVANRAQAAVYAKDHGLA